MKTYWQVAILVLLCACTSARLGRAQNPASAQPRMIELTADEDSRYRMGSVVSPTIEVAPGEHLLLRITAVRAKQVARDGSIHGLALLDKNQDAVPGWRFYLHPGVQELEVTAPTQPGRYSAVCTIICSDMHDGMGFTVVVVEKQVTNSKE
jgi:heme/copper-type cytochrome/quinol oxidase subunit 2